MKISSTKITNWHFSCCR